jgi:hypothetical protein
LEELKSLIVKKIREDAAANRLVHRPDLGHLLYRWHGWGNDVEPREWVKDLAKRDDGLVRLLEAFLGESRSTGAGERYVRHAYRLDPKALEPFVDVETIIDRARRLSESGTYTGRDRAALQQFVRGYEMRARGEDPNW